jgi:hypothetical protein
MKIFHVFQRIYVSSSGIQLNLTMATKKKILRSRIHHLILTFCSHIIFSHTHGFFVILTYLLVVYCV